MDQILVATDGSEYSEGAVREAINVAKSCGSQLCIIEINPEFLALAPAIIEEKERELKIHLEGIKDRAAKENVECETMIREGDEPYKLIIEEADKKQVELIVLGRRGRKGLMRLLMGSATARVIGHASHKVLVIPGLHLLSGKTL
jgi:nucleotide-binding universal stress UspA family protein